MKKTTSSIYSFEKLRSEGYLYVDKTEFIWNLVNSAGESYFLSRPRRFGKSLTLSTLKAVFEGKKELFKGLAIYDKPYDWQPYPVIHLDLNGFDFNGANALRSSLCRLMRETANFHHLVLTESKPDQMFREIITELSRKQKIVILLDEYDKPILNNIDKPECKQILADLKAFYSVIKAFEGQLRFAFITGVTKFCHVSLFSDLNNLTDIAMDAKYATMLGYTQEEFEANFKEQIAAVEKNQPLSHQDFLAEIKNWYDGFRFEENAETVYNPVSLANFFENGGKFKNYWFKTGTPEFLVKLTQSQDFDFSSALNEPVPEIAFSAFEIDNIDPLTLLFQTGYVTIKGTVRNLGETWYLLDFPNREVSSGFNTYLLNRYSGQQPTGGVRFVSEIANALLKGDLERMHTVMEVFFAGIPYPAHKKNEATFQAIFFALFRLLGEYIEAESCTENGRIDAVVRTEKAVYLFEFKMDKKKTALAQIKQKEYFKKYLLDQREIYIIGVNFDSQKGNLIGWKTEKIR